MRFKAKIVCGNKNDKMVGQILKSFFDKKQVIKQRWELYFSPFIYVFIQSVRNCPIIERFLNKLAALGIEVIDCKGKN